MRISPNWMTLSVSLAILAQTLPTHAQTSELQPEPSPISDISQVSDISQELQSESTQPNKTAQVLTERFAEVVSSQESQDLARKTTGESTGETIRKSIRSSIKKDAIALVSQAELTTELTKELPTVLSSVQSEALFPPLASESNAPMLLKGQHLSSLAAQTIAQAIIAKKDRPSEAIALKEIHPPLSKPVALQVRDLAQDLVQQAVQASIQDTSARISLVAKIDAKSDRPIIATSDNSNDNSKVPIPKQTQAQVKSSPDRSVNGKKETAIAALRLIQLKEMRLAVNRPVTLLAQEPDTTIVDKPSTESKVGLTQETTPDSDPSTQNERSPQPVTVVSQDSNSEKRSHTEAQNSNLPASSQAANQAIKSTASVSIEKEPNQSLPGKTITDKKDEKKDTKIALGLDPIAPLTVPTTPSQVKIERNQGVKLEEALALATSNNRDIALARIAVDRARGVLQEAEAAKLPTVNAQGTYTYSDSAQTRLSNIAANPLFSGNSTTSQSATGTIGINYNVYTSGLVDANIRTAENQLRIAEADLNRVSQAVRINIATAYYTLQNSDATVLIRQKSVENRERSLQDTSALEKAGVGTKFDVLQSQVQLSNAQQSLLDAQANQLVARRDLARILVYPPNVDITAADPIEPAPDWKLSLEESILLAYKNRSELDIQKLQREVARDRTRAALARVGPQVGLFTNLNIADNLNQVGGAALGYSVGVNFSMSLFDGGVANAQFNQFKADQATAEVQFDKAGDQARFDVEQAYINIQSRRTQISTTAQAVEQSNEALRLARLRLSAGVGTQLEVIRAEEDLTQAQVNRLQAIIGFNQSLANLQRAINGL